MSIVWQNWPCYGSVLVQIWWKFSGCLLATSHLTHDPNNLMTRMDYAGQDHIHMVNSTIMSIKFIGQTSFQSPFQPRLLVLTHLLHVPSVTKNLLFVSKFNLLMITRFILSSFLILVLWKIGSPIKCLWQGDLKMVFMPLILLILLLTPIYLHILSFCPVKTQFVTLLVIPKFLIKL